MKPEFTLYGLMILIASGCDSCKTTPDTSDTTAPTITWSVKNETQNTTTSLSGNASFNAKKGDQLVVTACANDDGGLKELETWSNSSHSCVSGNIGQNVGPGLAVPTVTPLGLDQDGKAWSKYCAFLNLDLTFTCNPGYTFSAGSATVNCKGTNYAGLATNGVLSISVSP